MYKLAFFFKFIYSCLYMKHAKVVWAGRLWHHFINTPGQLTMYVQRLSNLWEEKIMVQQKVPQPPCWKPLLLTVLCKLFSIIEVGPTAGFIMRWQDMGLFSSCEEKKLWLQKSAAFGRFLCFNTGAAFEKTNRLLPHISTVHISNVESVTQTNHNLHKSEASNWFEAEDRGVGSEGGMWQRTRKCRARRYENTNSYK